MKWLLPSAVLVKPDSWGGETSKKDEESPHASAKDADGCGDLGYDDHFDESQNPHPLHNPQRVRHPKPLSRAKGAPPAYEKMRDEVFALAKE